MKLILSTKEKTIIINQSQIIDIESSNHHITIFQVNKSTVLLNINDSDILLFNENILDSDIFISCSEILSTGKNSNAAYCKKLTI